MGVVGRNKIGDTQRTSGHDLEACGLGSLLRDEHLRWVGPLDP